jgi:dGTP triphosphohydrolase
MFATTSWRLERDLDATNAELATIHEDAQSLARAIEQMVRDFADRHSISIESALDGISAALLDLTDDAARPVEARAEELKQQIATIEETDLRRSGPVVL